jgi:hypothetical protein
MIDYRSEQNRERGCFQNKKTLPKRALSTHSALRLAVHPESGGVRGSSRKSHCLPMASESALNDTTIVLLTFPR